jgi:hypothetical protein
MSRAYRISVAESLRRHVRVKDGFATRLELLAILPEARMAELLAAELEKVGFERDGDRLRRVDDDGVEIEVDARSGEVTVRIAAEADVEVKEQQTAVSARDNDREAEERLRRRVLQSLEGKVAAQEETLRQEVSAKLEKKLRDLRKELDGAVGRCLGEALKEKARTMGEIEEISEDEEGGSLTIRVRV